MEVIKILEPRYRDMRVLVARFRIPCGGDIKVKIVYGARKGLYMVKNADICASPIEYMTTRAGKKIPMRAIPIDKLERIEE